MHHNILLFCLKCHGKMHGELMYVAASLFLGNSHEQCQVSLASSILPCSYVSALLHESVFYIPPIKEENNPSDFFLVKTWHGSYLSQILELFQKGYLFWAPGVELCSFWRDFSVLENRANTVGRGISSHITLTRERLYKHPVCSTRCQY